MLLDTKNKKLLFAVYKDFQNILKIAPERWSINKNGMLSTIKNKVRIEIDDFINQYYINLMTLYGDFESISFMLTKNPSSIKALFNKTTKMEIDLNNSIEKLYKRVKIIREESAVSKVQKLMERVYDETNAKSEKSSV